MIDWLAIVVSVVLPIVVGVGGWFGQRIIGRIDAAERRIAEMSNKASARDTQQDGRLDNLEKTSLTKEAIREVLDAALQPLTQELKAISSSHQETRERIIRLEASSGRGD